MNRSPRDARAAAATLGRLSLLFLAHAIGTASITVALATSPAIESSLGLGHSAFGLLVSAYWTAGLVLAIPAGWLVDRFGLRTMLVVANLLFALGLWTFAQASATPLAALGLALAGGGYALVNPATARGVLMWFPQRGRATAMSVKQTGVPAGGALAALAAGSGGADWRELATALALVAAFASIAYAALPGGREHAASSIRLRDVGGLLRRRPLALFNGAACLYAASQAAFFAYLVLFVTDAQPGSLALAGLCLAVAHIGSAAGRVSWGVSSDRLVRHGRTFCLVLVGLLSAAALVALLLATVLGARAAMPVAAALVGFTLGGYAGMMQTAAVEAVEATSAGAAIGYNMLGTTLGNVLGPAAFGIALSSLGYTATWSATAALLLVGAALFRTIRRYEASGQRSAASASATRAGE
jgi:predicted MFS family arabinose efflux permease